MIGSSEREALDRGSSHVLWRGGALTVGEYASLRSQAEHLAHDLVAALRDRLFALGAPPLAGALRGRVEDYDGVRAACAAEDEARRAWETETRIAYEQSTRVADTEDSADEIRRGDRDLGAMREARRK